MNLSLCKNEKHIVENAGNVCQRCRAEQLDRIEAKLDLLLARSASQTDYAAHQERERLKQQSYYQQRRQGNYCP